MQGPAVCYCQWSEDWCVHINNADETERSSMRLNPADQFAWSRNSSSVRHFLQSEKQPINSTQLYFINPQREITWISLLFWRERLWFMQKDRFQYFSQRCELIFHQLTHFHAAAAVVINLSKCQRNQSGTQLHEDKDTQITTCETAVFCFLFLHMENAANLHIHTNQWQWVRLQHLLTIDYGPLLPCRLQEKWLFSNLQPRFLLSLLFSSQSMVLYQLQVT